MQTRSLLRANTNKNAVRFSESPPPCSRASAAVVPSVPVSITPPSDPLHQTPLRTDLGLCCFTNCSFGS
ncbi:unnamed protein product [Knipowitschia caucasica]